ncbi:hypothetical protein FIBSPDRAFT_927830 [Athelia psychrophila]|uniref:Uncharacterized protein n=1 Tax=Athelia psychrophila TaxID=1759441 RepID=A0A166R2Y8_9AGAM|nr:hypothetical protein FIBSPDRAFT_927830 [Fibularhizoctonia sp. CBS 109695]
MFRIVFYFIALNNVQSQITDDRELNVEALGCLIWLGKFPVLARDAESGYRATQKKFSGHTRQSRLLSWRKAQSSRAQTGVKISGGIAEGQFCSWYPAAAAIHCSVPSRWIGKGWGGDEPWSRVQATFGTVCPAKIRDWTHPRASTGSLCGQSKYHESIMKARRRDIDRLDHGAFAFTCFVHCQFEEEAKLLQRAEMPHPSALAASGYLGTGDLGARRRPRIATPTCCLALMASTCRWYLGACSRTISYQRS